MKLFFLSYSSQIRGVGLLLFFMHMAFFISAQQLDVVNGSAGTKEAAVIQNASNHIGLQVTQSGSSSPSAAVQIVNAGLNHAIDIDVTNSSNNIPAMDLSNGGLNIGILSRNSNPLNTLPSVYGINDGTTADSYGVAGENTKGIASVVGVKRGTATGFAGFFNNTNNVNVSAALRAESNSLGAAFLGFNSGLGVSVKGEKTGAATGHVAHFNNTNAANLADALLVETNSDAPAIFSENKKDGPSISSRKAVGTSGPAGIFENQEPLNGAGTVVGISNGGTPVFEAIQTGTGLGFVGVKAGTATGIIANFDNLNVFNLDPVVRIANVNKAGSELGLLVEANVRVDENTATQHLDVLNMAARPAAIISSDDGNFEVLNVSQIGLIPGLASAASITQLSEGNGLEINILDTSNGADALISNTNGLGSAGSFMASDFSNGSSALIGIHKGIGPGVAGENDFTGHAVVGTKPFGGVLGHAGFFHTVDAGNPDAALKIIHANPAANALDVDGNVLFSGDLLCDDICITGTLCAAAKAFKIDHPLDPDNQYLQHISIESDEMMNLYTGNVILDQEGKAQVELPHWFEALNEDFRYHLTCIGGFAPVYIAQEIKDGVFEIAGGSQGLKISWQVTGIRHDDFAEKNPLQVELPKTNLEH